MTTDEKFDEDDGNEKGMTDEEFRIAAREQYQREGAIEIDSNAVISRGSDCGAYVQAWVWVDDAVPSDGSPLPEDYWQ